MLDLFRLRVLRAVHLCGSVTQAAVALECTPSAVSQHLTRLERETGTTLLERRGRGVALTDAAQVLVASAGRMLAIVEETEAELERRRGRPGGTLTVAAFSTAARGLLPPVLARLVREHPQITPRLVESDPHASVGLVSRGTVDVAVTHDWDTLPLSVPDDLRQVPLGDDHCDVVLPAGHPLSGRRVVTPRDIAAERLICHPSGTVCRAWLVRTVRDTGREPDLAYEVAEYATQLSLVAAGLGVAVVPRLGRESLPQGVVAVRMEPAPVRRLSVLWRAGASQRPAITEMVRRLVVRCRDEWPPENPDYPVPEDPVPEDPVPEDPVPEDPAPGEARSERSGVVDGARDPLPREFS